MEALERRGWHVIVRGDEALLPGQRESHRLTDGNMIRRLAGVRMNATGRS